MAIHKGMMPKAEKFVKREHKMLIDGHWINSVSSDRIDVVNPANGKVFTSLSSGDEVDVDRAVQAARAALNGELTRPLKL